MESTDLRQRLFFFLAFAILIILTLSMIKPFFTTIIVSLISVIMLKPVYNFFLGRQWIRGRKTLAASLTLIALLLMLIIPTYLIVRITITQLSGMFDQLAALDLDAVLEDIRQSLEGLPLVGPILPADTGATETVQPVARSVAEALANFAVSLGASLPSLFVQGILFVVLVASLLPVYDVMIPQIEEISPLGFEISELYNRKITAMVRSLVLGVFLIAIIQGVAMGFFFWIAGLPYVFLFTLLSMFLALIPMVGISWLVIAIAIVAFLTGNWVQALIVLGGFYGVVNWIDILLRPKLLAEDATINFALFMLAIFGGIAWAGIMGLFYGPVIMLLLVTTIEIYAERYAKEDSSLLDRAFKNLGGSQSPAEPAEMEQQAQN
jgi:predicted PurR-regulated permease PerM